MPTPPLPRAEIERRSSAYRQAVAEGHAPVGTPSPRGKPSALRLAADRLGVNVNGIRRALAQMEGETEYEPEADPVPFDPPALPSEIPSADEILERREREWQRRHAAKEARRIIPIRLKVGGVIGLAIMGDPHIDDPGCDIPALRRDVRIMRDTPGMLAVNIGDIHNNWTGRLVHLHQRQGTTSYEAWALVEWLCASVPWLAMVRGNHDCWAGVGDPLDWIKRGVPGPVEKHGARLSLQHPNGTETRIHARHDFPGHSQWNAGHGPQKAAQMGWRDHILVAGHHHTSAHAMERDPMTGLISHCVRVGSYKRHDSFADERFFANKNMFPSCLFVIDPSKPDDDPARVTFIPDLEAGADFLTFKRRKDAA